MPVSQRNALILTIIALMWGGGQTPFSDPDFDKQEPREVINTMIRCRKWLESRGYEITMTCIYKEIKIRKINLE